MGYGHEVRTDRERTSGRGRTNGQLMITRTYENESEKKEESKKIQGKVVLLVLVSSLVEVGPTRAVTRDGDDLSVPQSIG
jgi:hypothetical protein